MPNSAQAKKRHKQDEDKRLLNKSIASRMKTRMKKTQQYVEAKDVEAAEKSLAEAFKCIDKAAKKRVIHANSAAHKKSLLSRQINKLKNS